jgi:serpin B
MGFGRSIEAGLSRRNFLDGIGALTCLLAAGGGALSANGGAEDVSALTQAYNACGRRLIADLGRTSGNVTLSPYSIGAAMAMALAGARGATEVEMRNALMQTLSGPEIAAANGKAAAAILANDNSSDRHLCSEGMAWTGHRCEGPPKHGGCGYDGALDGGKCVSAARMPVIRLSVANALMLSKKYGDLISPDYRALVKESFSAEVFEGASIDDVNQWVNRKTEGKIDKILDDLDDLTAAVLLNAIYLRAPWAVQFEKTQTISQDFHISSNAAIKAPMMRRGSDEMVIAGPGFRAIRLGLGFSKLGMIIVLPNDVDGLATVDQRLDDSMRADLLKSFDAASAATNALTVEPRGSSALHLPKFKAVFGADLVAPFRKLGLKLAFSDDADFSGMATARARLKIDQIIHRAIVEVAEDGVEAAGATAVAMVKAASIEAPEPIRRDFIVDHPFLFLIAERTTEAVLFEGRIIDPTKSA